jgi:hypothetical protein
MHSRRTIGLELVGSRFATILIRGRPRQLHNKHLADKSLLPPTASTLLAERLIPCLPVCPSTFRIFFELRDWPATYHIVISPLSPRKPRCFLVSPTSTVSRCALFVGQTHGIRSCRSRLKVSAFVRPPGQKGGRGGKGGRKMLPRKGVYVSHTLPPSLFSLRPAIETADA